MQVAPESQQDERQQKKCDDQQSGGLGCKRGMAFMRHAGVVLGNWSGHGAIVALHRSLVAAGDPAGECYTSARRHGRTAGKRYSLDRALRAV